MVKVTMKSLFFLLATWGATSAFVPISSSRVPHTSGKTELYSHKLVLVRHGESTWNDLNIFTGWADAELNEKGKEEALQGGKLLKESGFTFDVAYTSVLKRAIKTLWIILEELDLMYIPIVSYCGECFILFNDVVFMMLYPSFEWSLMIILNVLVILSCPLICLLFDHDMI
mmetsp:Transcript_11751/g.24379  ORF Transcript_11751/g.24379 Transcript_11751/m.24379 type:complete len:171 (-) Transcript_11751:744-1256(-)